ncbi:MAG: Pathogenesis-related transcriptional factor and ERF protein [Lewinellaceae bacterium]|nr:Pathogenesis-related transcriptional factor and ERF protein [Lewinellaceae bacterium]
MLYKVKLKNADDTVLLDDKVYEYLTTDSYLVKVDFINNLRKHSSGCAVFQKTWKKADGGYKTETIYLHKLIAEKFLVVSKTQDRRLVGAKNGNKLDCRLENLVYRSRSVASRKRKTSSKAGYTGVYKENNRYRAVISVNRKSVHIGMFSTAEEAAMAYNAMSKKLYGDDGKLNQIKPREEWDHEPPKPPAKRGRKPKAKD